MRGCKSILMADGRMDGPLPLFFLFPRHSFGSYIYISQTLIAPICLLFMIVFLTFSTSWCLFSLRQCTRMKSKERERGLGINFVGDTYIRCLRLQFYYTWYKSLRGAHDQFGLTVNDGDGCDKDKKGPWASLLFMSLFVFVFVVGVLVLGSESDKEFLI